MNQESGRQQQEGEAAFDDHWQVLIRLAQRGDEDAFEQFYLLSARWLLARIRRIVADPDAEDVLAEAFIQVWRTIGTYDESRASPAAWLAMIGRSRALDHLRAARSRLTVPIDEDEFDLRASDEGPEDAFVRSRNAKILHQCLYGLEGNERLALGLSYFSGYTAEEIARSMDIPVSDVRSHLARGRRKLRLQLGSNPPPASVTPVDRRS